MLECMLYRPTRGDRGVLSFIPETIREGTIRQEIRVLVPVGCPFGFDVSAMISSFKIGHETDYFTPPRKKGRISAYAY